MSSLKCHMKKKHFRVFEKQMTTIRKEVKTTLNEDTQEGILEKSKTLILQGKFLELFHKQNSDATWKSYIHNLPKGTLKLILNAALDTLPTKTNLKRWGKGSNERCSCGLRQTLNHVLNCCNPSLNLKSILGGTIMFYIK